jgi:hypothetical protein
VVGVVVQEGEMEEDVEEEPVEDLEVGVVVVQEAEMEVEMEVDEVEAPVEEMEVGVVVVPVVD